MSNWWQGTVLALTTIFATFESQPAYAIVSIADSSKIQIVKDRQTTLVARQAPVCSRLATTASKVYAFETQSYCISICQAEDEFFYLRQSRANPKELLILPATAVFGGSVFQAIDGKTIYFVGIDANGHYSSVMRSDDEIVFEPEIQPTMVELPNNSPRPTFGKNIPFLSNFGENGLDDSNINNFEETSWKICTQNKSNFDSLLNGWQKLIGVLPTVTSDCQVPFKFN